MSSKCACKADLAEIIMSKKGVNKATALRMIEVVVDAFNEAIFKNGGFCLVNEFSMTVVKTKPRKGRNPRTGEAVDIPAKNKIKFSAGKYLLDEINK